MWRQLVYEFQNLNVYIVLILSLTAAGMVVFLEKIFSLAISQRMNYHRFLVELKTMLRAHDWERALRYCDGQKNNILAALSAKSLESFLDKPSEAIHTIEEEASAIVPKVEARLSLISAIATTVLLLGVLATIHSLWDIVYTAQETGGTGGISLLELGLSRCLAPLAFALSACTILYLGNYFSVAIAERLLNYLQQLSILLGNYLTTENSQLSVAKASLATTVNENVDTSPRNKEAYEEEVI